MLCLLRKDLVYGTLAYRLIDRDRQNYPVMSVHAQA